MIQVKSNQNDNPSNKKPSFWNANQIIIHNQTPHTKTFFLPVFSSFQLRNFVSLNINQLSAQLNGILHLYIYFGTLPNHIIQFITNKLRIHLFMDNSIILNNPNQKQSNIKYKYKKKRTEIGETQVRQFFVHRYFSARIVPYVFFTPFQLLDLKVSVEMPGNISHIVDGVQYNFLFNMMDIDHGQNQQNLQKCLMYSQSGTINYYDLAQSRLCVQYNKQPLPKEIYYLKPDPGVIGKLTTWYYNKKRNRQAKRRDQIWKSNLKKIQERFQEDGRDFQQLEPIQSFSYAHYHIPIYKFPFVSLASIFFPLWMLGLINVAGYHAELELAERMAVIAFISLGYVQIMLLIRSQIPNTYIITFLELSLYANFLSILLLLIDSIDQQQLNIYTKAYYGSIVIFISSIVFPFIAYLYHKLFLQPSYNINKVPQAKRQTYWDLQPNYNKQANSYFEEKKNDGRYKLMFQRNEEMEYQGEGQFFGGSFGRAEEWKLRKEYFKE